MERITELLLKGEEGSKLTVLDNMSTSHPICLIVQDDCHIAITELTAEDFNDFVNKGIEILRKSVVENE